MVGRTSKIKNGGFMKFKSGHLKIIWDTFIRAPEDWQLNYYRKGIVHHKYYENKTLLIGCVINII